MYYICCLIHPALVWNKTNIDYFFPLFYIKLRFKIIIYFSYILFIFCFVPLKVPLLWIIALKQKQKRKQLMPMAKMEVVAWMGYVLFSFDLFFFTFCFLVQFHFEHSFNSVYQKTCRKIITHKMIIFSLSCWLLKCSWNYKTSRVQLSKSMSSNSQCIAILDICHQTASFLIIKKVTFTRDFHTLVK